MATGVDMYKRITMYSCSFNRGRSGILEGGGAPIIKSYN